ncbi:MAG: ABC transporter substrate-binding protein [Actinomycetota bacterium]
MVGSIRGAVVLVLAAFAAAACNGEPTTGIATTVAPTTTDSPPVRVDDQVLRIGLVVPAEPATIGASIEASAEEAVEQINDVGGVLGTDVELFVVVDGDTLTSAAAAVEVLAADDIDVDAMVGPVSSLTATAALDVAVDAQIVSCSATASAIDLTDFPDDGLFFRTVPSDALQAEAIADRVERTGAADALIVHVDDPFGRSFAAAAEDSLRERSIGVASAVGVPPAVVEAPDALDDALDLGADVVIVLASAADTLSVLSILDGASVDARRIVVNDAVRNSESAPALAELSDDFRSRVVGVAPAVVIRDDEGAITTGPFEVQVEDCINLIALAALQGGSDAPALIASQMPSVSTGGSPCSTFEQCAQRIDQGLQINYNGRSGTAELTRTGETSRAEFETFVVGDDGTPEFDTTFPVSV